MTLNHSGATMSSTPATVSTFIASSYRVVQAGEEPQQDAREHGHGDRPGSTEHGPLRFDVDTDRCGDGPPERPESGDADDPEDSRPQVIAKDQPLSSSNTQATHRAEDREIADGRSVVEDRDANPEAESEPCRRHPDPRERSVAAHEQAGRRCIEPDLAEREPLRRSDRSAGDRPCNNGRPNLIDRANDRLGDEPTDGEADEGQAPPPKVFATERVTRSARLDVCIGHGNPSLTCRAGTSARHQTADVTGTTEALSGITRIGDDDLKPFTMR